MPARKKAILYLTSSKLWIILDSGSDADTYELDWDNDLLPAFKTLKNDLQVNNVRVLIGAGISNTLTVKTESEDRQAIFEAAQEKLSTKIDNHSFDWKKQSDGQIQIVSISPYLLNLISYASNQSGVVVETILPAASVLALGTSDLPQPHLILWTGPETVLVVASAGTVHYARSISDTTADTIENTIVFAKHELGLEIKHLIHDLPDEIVPDVGSFLEIQSRDLNPMQLLANKKNLKGADKDILAISTVDVSTKPVSPDEPEKQTESIGSWDKKLTTTPPKDAPPSKKLLVGVTLLTAFLVTLIAGGIFLANNPESVPFLPEPTPTPTPVPEPTPTPTPEPVDFSNYDLQILNGTGIPGAAGEIEELLADLDFDSVDTDNADSYDYEKTEIQLKENLSESAFTDLADLLTDYDPVLGDSLDADSDFDIIIIVGPK